MCAKSCFIVLDAGAVLRTAVIVEVKASNGSTISLNELLEKPQVPYGYKLVDGNLGVMGMKITLPHYMAMFI